jgi:flagellar biosynthetic protein FlhB
MSEGQNEDDSSKTEDPSQKKLEDARQKGQVAQSKEMGMWIVLLMVTLIIAVGSGPLFTAMNEYLRGYFERAGQMPTGIGGIASILTDMFLKTLGFVAIPFILLMVASYLGTFVQIGFLIAPEVIKPEFSKISIFKGFKRLFSMKSIVELIKGIVKLVVVGIVTYVLIQPYFAGIEHTVNQTMGVLLEDIYTLTIKVLLGILIVLFFMALADLLYQRWEFNKQMRMTKQEVKDEYKQTEGDPYVKGKLKQMRMDKARIRMMANVPKADVIITNPTHFAIALKYDPEKSDAPTVIAKGVDELALRIREVAKEHDIIIYENPPLARSLYDLVDLDEAIPQELYKAVAEVITFVYQKKGKLKPRTT